MGRAESQKAACAIEMKKRNQLLFFMIAGDTVTYFLPLILTLPNLFTFVAVFTYFIDSMGLYAANGALCGICGALVGLKCLPILCGVSARCLHTSLTVMSCMWALLLVGCMVAPMNPRSYCYLSQNCD